MDIQSQKTGGAINIGSELAGSIGDLGTMLPFVIGAITIGGMDTTSILVVFGLMYLFTAWFYRLPIPVQPMKVIGAAIIVQNLSTGEIAASGLITGICLLLIALSGAIDHIVKITPRSVVMGIQSGLGVSLALLGIKMVRSDLLLGIIILLVMLLLLQSKRFPASIVALIGGTTLAFTIHPDLVFPTLVWDFNLPHVVFPAWHDFNRGFFVAFLPQLPLTLTNSVLVIAVLAGQLFPQQAERVNHRNLCLTLAIGNIIAAPLGGLPMCHGSGGLAAHYRFGARTWLSIAFLGSILLFLGIFLGSSGLQLMHIIPSAVLGGLLFYSGLDLIRPVVSDDRKELFVYTTVLILSVAFNPGIGFLIGVPVMYCIQKGWLRI